MYTPGTLSQFPIKEKRINAFTIGTSFLGGQTDELLGGRIRRGSRAIKGLGYRVQSALASYRASPPYMHTCEALCYKNKNTLQL